MIKNIKNNSKLYALGILAAVNFLIWFAVFAEERRGLMTVSFFDVGQGDAIFIQSPTGRQVLIDGGPDRKVIRGLSGAMPFYDRSIDVVIATHPDKDHIGGLPEIFDRYKVSTFIESGVKSSSGIQNALKEIVKNENSKQLLARRGMIIDIGGGAFLKVLFPDRDIPEIDSNNASVIIRLTYGQTSFLLTGDSPQSIEEYLVLIDGENLDSDVLKVGHHGSKTSSSQLFVGFVSPEYAVISVGADNKYGHPNKETIQVLEDMESKIISTGESGTIIFESDGNSIIVDN